MRHRLHVKTGDEIVVLTGKDKGKRGKIKSVLTKRCRVLVEGVNLQKKHLKKSQQHPNGTILEREGSIHASNVMLATKFDARRAKRTVADPAPAATV
ncbi:MAG: 50S ribosomal protein L24 [Verrucomicrobia bacterium]|nr:50S ribosomal protein L24 [Verrucomicrobiota bacterium]MBM3870991.1 50S ribosomal protein L24 [Verrucomicrobiota bacterium]